LSAEQTSGHPWTDRHKMRHKLVWVVEAILFAMVQRLSVSILIEQWV
jgi:hypothetical protein